MRVAIVSAIALSAILGCAQVCKADSVSVTTTTTGSSCVNPSVTTVTPAPSLSRMVIMGTTPVANSSSTSAVYQFGPYENFARRLSMMGDQINLGVSRGMISSAQADSLMAEHDRLLSKLNDVRYNGFLEADANDLEKRLNVFNVQISQILTDGAKTAGIGVFQ